MSGSISALFLCIVLAACGSASKSSSGSSGGNGGSGGGNGSNVTMQQGQWEFVASSGGTPLYIEANLTDSGSGIFSTVYNTGFGANEATGQGGDGSGFGFCANLTTDGTISSNNLTGTITSPGASSQVGSFSAVIAANGQSVSGGSYSGGSCSFVSWTTGTLTGYTVAPLNGTFSGTLTTTSGPDQITLSITQNANFGITASGTSLQNGVTTSLAISPDGTPTDNTNGYSNVIGATIQASGTGTSVNGSSTFQVFGHFNPSGTQITIGAIDQPGGELETGTLTKQ